MLTRRLNLSDEDGQIAVALGIGAIFAAPGGAVLAASITYRDDFDYR